jgi:hypothetical protein
MESGTGKPSGEGAAAGGAASAVPEVPAAAPIKALVDCRKRRRGLGCEESEGNGMAFVPMAAVRARPVATVAKLARRANGNFVISIFGHLKRATHEPT